MGTVLTARVFLPFMLGFFLSYLFRSINNVIAPDLVRDVGVDASGLGLLTGIYMITFAAFQMPLGILLDRFGPRRTEAALLMFAAAGAFIFATATSPAALIAGRGLIGFGVSACLMAAFKSFVDWLPAERLPFANAIMFATGGIGAMSATVPVETALQFTDWRGVFLFLTAAAVGVAVLIFAVVPEKAEHRAMAGQGTLAQQISGTLQILRSPVIFTIAPFSTATQATTMAVLTLWTGPWLRDVAGWSRAEVAAGLFWIAAATTAGYLASGWVATRLARRGIRPERVAVTGMVVFLFVQVLILTEAPIPPLAIWSLYAIFGISGGVMYASLSQKFPTHLAGRVNTTFNMFIFIYAFAAQWGVGAIINLWPMAPNGQFAAEGYGRAFLAMLGIQVALFVWWLISRLIWRTPETIRRPQDQEVDREADRAPGGDISR